MLPRDREGNVVEVGTLVKILNIGEEVLRLLSDDEKKHVLTMVGEVFEVFEIDEPGFIWVQKFWNRESSNPYSHMVGVCPTDVQVVRHAS